MILRLATIVVLVSLAASAPADRPAHVPPTLHKAAMLARANEALADNDPLAARDCLREAFHAAALSAPANAQLILTELRSLRGEFQLAERIQQLTAGLAETPDDQALRAELARLLFTVAEDPAAAGWVDEAAAPDLARWIHLAQRPVDSLATDEALDLARGYQSHAAAAGPQTQCRLLAKALSCYQRFLATCSPTDPRSDLAAADAIAICDRLDALAPSGPVALQPGVWVDVYPDLRRERGMLVHSSGGALWRDMPIAITGAYDLEVEFSLVEPDASFGILAPCGDKQAHLFVNRPNKPANMDTLGEMMVSPSVVTVGRTHRLGLVIRPDQVASAVLAELDGRSFLIGPSQSKPKDRGTDMTLFAQGRVAVTWLGVRGHEPGATLTMPHPYWRPVRQRTVRANRAWQWVSEVKAGNILRISADGVWSWNGVDSAGPGGDEAGWHALYGRLGPDGEPFLIGSGQWLIARENGVLSMQMEDTYRTDNTGVVSVSIDAFDPNSTAMRQPHLFGSTGREAPTVDDDVGLLFSDDQLQPPYTYHPTDACALAEQFLSAAQAVEGELAVALARRAVDLAGPHERGVEIADAATALLPTEPTEPAPWKRGEWIDLLAPLTADRLPDRIRPAVGGGLELLSCPKEYVVGFRLPVAVKGAFVLEIRATPLHRAANFHISLATDDSRSYQEIALPDANREVLIRVEGTAASEGGIETIFVDGEQIDVDDPRAYAPHSDDNPTPLGDQFYLMADPTSFLIHSARLMAEDADPLLVPPPAQPWSEFSVRANAKSTPTLGLHRGDRVEVEATGHYWTPWTGRGQMAIADADGLLAGGNDSVGYLEGRIGDGEFFRIGSRLAFTADADGVLHLRMRDDDRTDNAGQLYVKIRILR